MGSVFFFFPQTQRSNLLGGGKNPLTVFVVFKKMYIMFRINCALLVLASHCTSASSHCYYYRSCETSLQFKSIRWATTP